MNDRSILDQIEALVAEEHELDGPDPEPRHTDHGVHERDSSWTDPAPNALYELSRPLRRSTSIAPTVT